MRHEHVSVRKQCGEELQPFVAPMETGDSDQCPLEAENPSEDSNVVKKLSDNTVVAFKAHSDKKMSELMATKLSNQCNVGNCIEDVMRSFWSGDLPHFGHAHVGG